jgi:hypothetical protein
MSRVKGVVQDGQIRLVESIPLPEGAEVFVEWADTPPSPEPLEREPWTEEDVRQEIEWARTWRWKS